MDSIYMMRVFAAVAEKLSFAHASRVLDISPAAVTRAIVQLEKSLGTKLLQRHERRIQLTDSGRTYFEHARGVIALLEEANAAVVRINTAARGHLKVTAPVLFGKLFVMQGISDYLHRYPDMEVSAMFVDRTVNLIDEGFDVAIRIGQLPDSGMKALLLGQVRRVTCAAPSYLARNGVPGHPNDLQDHSIISTDGAAQSVVWKFGTDPASLAVKLKPRLGVSSNDAAIEAAKLGVGIAQLPSYQVVAQIAAGTLKPVLQDYPSDSLPIHLLHRQGKFSAAKVKNFIDLISERLRSDSRFH